MGPFVANGPSMTDLSNGGGPELPGVQGSKLQQTSHCRPSVQHSPNQQPLSSLSEQHLEQDLLGPHAPASDWDPHHQHAWHQRHCYNLLELHHLALVKLAHPSEEPEEEHDVVDPY